MLEKLTAKEMPPEEAKQHPAPDLRQAVIDWIQAMRRHEAERNAGDPGPVLARRLSNAEYDYTIRDLTDVDIRPTKEFPVDPANEAGFDNSGESLTMSPALVKKYLEAARRVAEHVVLKPSGFGSRRIRRSPRRTGDKVLREAHREFLSAAADRLCRLFSGCVAFQESRRTRQTGRNPGSLRRGNRISAKYLLQSGPL